MKRQTFDKQVRDDWNSKNPTSPSEWAAVIYSSGQRVYDHLFLIHKTKTKAIASIKRRFKDMSKLYVRDLGATVYFSTTNWDPSEDQKKVGYIFNIEANVVAQLSVNE